MIARVGIPHHGGAIPTDNAPVKIGGMGLLFLENFVRAFRCRVAGASGCDREIHGNGLVDEQQAALFAQRDFHRGISFRGFGHQYLVTVGLFAPSGLAAERCVLFLGADHLWIGATRFHAFKHRAARNEESGGERRKKGKFSGGNHRLPGKPDTVCIIPVIME